MNIKDLYIERTKVKTDINERLHDIYNITIESNAKQIIELGVRGAESTVSFLAALEQTNGKLWSCDINVPIENAIHLKSNNRWTFVQGSDRDLVNQAPTQCDILFIDTSHTYEDTLFELNSYHTKVKPGGYIMLHDVEGPMCSGVVKALDEFMLTHPAFSLSVINGNNGLGIIKIPKV